MTTTHVKASEVAERWFEYDASEHTLGRMAAQIATQLRGKDRPTFTPSEHGATHVIVVNATQMRLSGRKAEQNEYQTYSGYPGGRKVLSLDKINERRPTDVVTLAVRRMLPKNRLGKTLLRRLKVYSGKDHPHSAQKPVRVEPKQS